MSVCYSRYSEFEFLHQYFYLASEMLKLGNYFATHRYAALMKNLLWVMIETNCFQRMFLGVGFQCEFFGPVENPADFALS